MVDGERRFTYAEFAPAWNVRPPPCLQLGCRAGDRVAVLAPNGAMALEAHFAPMRIGAILVMLNTRLASAELEWILRTLRRESPAGRPATANRCVANAAVPSCVVDDYEAFLGARSVGRGRLVPPGTALAIDR